jgi:type I restriction enzyme, S subunit
MKLETFFKLFDKFADTPDAVAKMRGLLRQLAVTGALVDQDKNDEPALALLDRIAAYKTLLAQEGKLRGSTTVTPIPPSEGSRILPSSWTWVRFGEVMVNRDGERIPVSKEERAAKAKTYDYYGASGVIDKIDGFLFDKPLLLIGEDGANLINRSTPIAFMARGQYWVNNHAHVLDGISEDFLRYIELYINAINLEPYVTGSAQPKMNQAKMNSIPIALPPLAEQKRIVAKVDELMALCDRLEAQQREREEQASKLARASLARFAESPTPENLEYVFHKSYTIPPADLRKSILTLAVQGKLVPQDPNDVAVEESVKASREKAGLAVRALTELSSDESPFEVPESWRWVTVADVANTRLGKMLDKEKNRGESHPYLRNTNVHWFRFELESVKTMLFESAELHEYRVESGDVLICEGGHGIARSAVWDGQIPGIMFQKALHRVRPLSCLNGHFLTFCLWVYERDGILQRYYTGAGIPHFTGKALALVTFPLPPLVEQRRIVAKVEQLMALVDELEQQLAASHATAANLLSALVAELTGAPNHGKVSVPAVTTTGRRGRPAKS